MALNVSNDPLPRVWWRSAWEPWRRVEGRPTRWRMGRRSAIEPLGESVRSVASQSERGKERTTTRERQQRSEIERGQLRGKEWFMGRVTHATPFKALNSPTPNVVTRTPRPCLTLAYPSAAYAPHSSFAVMRWDQGQRVVLDGAMKKMRAYHLRPTLAVDRSRYNQETKPRQHQP